MREYVIGYIVAGGQWSEWSGGVDIYNHHTTIQTVKIEIQRFSSGIVGKTLNIDIPSKRHYLLTPDIIKTALLPADEGRATILITGPDELIITPFQWVQNDIGQITGLALLQVNESTNLKN